MCVISFVTGRQYCLASIAAAEAAVVRAGWLYSVQTAEDYGDAASCFKKKPTRIKQGKPLKDTDIHVVVVPAKENEVQWAILILAC